MSIRGRVREPLILLGLLVASWIVTWPLGKKLFSEFYVDGDPSATAWSLWWTKERIFSFEHPWSTTDLFAPSGTMLAYSAHFPLAGIVLSPATALLGPAVTVNLTKLVLPVLLSYVAYRLALEIGLPRWPALAAGVLYGCSAGLVYRADVHFNFAAGALITPLSLLAFVRYRRTERLLYAAAAGAALGLGLMLDPTHVLFGLIVGTAFVLGVLVLSRGRELRHLALGVSAVAATALVCASPQLVAMKKQRDAGQYTSDVPTLAGSWVLYGTTVQSLALPSPSFRLVKPVQRYSDEHRAGEGFPGYGPGLLLLAATGFALAFRRALVRWLGLLLLAASLMSLGPTLKIGGSIFTPLAIDRYGYELSSLMPYTWYVQIPGLADQRVAARFVMLGLLPAALLAGFGIAELMRRGLLARGALALLVIVAALDLGSPMSFLGEIEQPQLYAPIRKDKTRSIVVDVPLAWVTGTHFLGTPTNVQSMLRASEHRHPIAYGVVGRADVGLLTGLARHRFYTDLMLLQGGSFLGAATVPPTPDPAAGRQDARDLDVGWAVVRPTVAQGVYDYLEQTGFRPVEEHEGIRLFRRAP